GAGATTSADPASAVDFVKTRGGSGNQGPMAAAAEDLLGAHAAYVLRTLRCLGVPERELEDSRQDVLEVLARRSGEIENVRAWIYGVCMRKALARPRSAARRREDLGGVDE